MPFYQDSDPLETQEWQDAFDAVIQHVGRDRAAFLLKALYQQAIARHLPEAVVGVGTVLNAGDARRAHAAGARFAVSPGYTSEVGNACKDLGLPLLPGVATSSEIMAALADGYSFLKLFPAEAVGGIALLKSWVSPFGQVV